MRVGCLLSVREKATRLPNKVMLDIVGKPLTERLLERLSMAKNVDDLILSTSVHQDDYVLVELAQSCGYKAFQGSEDDKLERYYMNALEYDLDAVVIVDGDDLLCFPECVDMVASELRTDEYDCVYIDGLPLGAASTGLKTEALKQVLEQKDESHTEVWGGYFIGSDRFETKKIVIDNPLWRHPEIRLTLDYQEDYDFLVKTISAMGGRLDFTSDELMELLVNQRRDLLDINKGAQALYEDHISKSAPVKFKKVAGEEAR